MAEKPTRVKAPLPVLGEGSLRVGRLTKPHGLKGGLKVELFTDNPDERFAPNSVLHLQVPEDSQWFGRTLTVRELRWVNSMPVAFFAEVADRYAGQPDFLPRLRDRLISGGAGVWGPVPMPANAQVNADEAKKLAAWVLTQK